MSEINLLPSVDVASGVDVFLTALIYIVIIGVFAAVFFTVYMFRQYNIRAEITEITSNGRLVYNDKIRNYNNKDGQGGWRFLKSKSIGNKKKRIDEPSSKYIDLLKNGQKFCRFYKIGDTYTPWHPNFSDDNETINVDTDVMSINERVALVDELQAANSNYTKTNAWDVLNKALPIFAVLILFIGAIIFFDQVGQTLVDVTAEAGRVISESSESNTRLANALEILLESNDASSGREVPN